jgi:hypothetical protein
MHRLLANIPETGHPSNSFLELLYYRACMPNLMFCNNATLIRGIIMHLLKQVQPLHPRCVVLHPQNDKRRPLVNIHPSMVLQDVVDDNARPVPKNVSRHHCFSSETMSTAQFLSSSILYPRTDGETHFERTIEADLNIQRTKKGLGSVDLTPSFAEENDVFCEMKGNNADNIFATSALVPAGGFTGPHIDGHILHQYQYHVYGLKMWIFWEASAENVEMIQGVYPSTNFDLDTEQQLDLIQRLREPEVLIVDSVAEFTVPPFTIHAVITLTPSIHVSAWFIRVRELEKHCEPLNFLERWVKDVAKDGLNKVLDEMRWLEHEKESLELAKLKGLRGKSLEKTLGQVKRIEKLLEKTALKLKNS